MKNPTISGKYHTLGRARAPIPASASPAARALAPAVLLALLLYPGTPAAKSSDPAAASPAANPPAAGIRFDNIHLGLAANPPAPCTAPFYGTVTARAPDGALCLCHQKYDGKQGFWEQLGTGKACWPEKK
jgi:hypothetical protein